MSVEEIKNSLTAMTEEERHEVRVHLCRLRNEADREYHDLITARLDDKDPSHWISLDEFERRFQS